jgi:transketolase
VLARRGFFPVEELTTFRRLDSRLQGHPDMKKTPGVDFSSGSLGQGLSVGGGMAWGLRQLGSPARVYVLLGDGELNEGQVWEAAMSAAKFQHKNLTAIVDHNGVQLDGTTDCVMPLGSVAEKFRAFGWQTQQVDGHDISALRAALKQPADGPRVLIAHTVKGKGVPFMENDHRWHGSPLDEDQYRQALAALAQA